MHPKFTFSVVIVSETILSENYFFKPSVAVIEQSLFDKDVEASSFVILQLIFSEVRHVFIYDHMDDELVAIVIIVTTFHCGHPEKRYFKPHFAVNITNFSRIKIWT